ncbi:asparaginase [Rhodopila globiformis]|uniref:L-asparaginase n=1 Tax=Rhodopila globiformis TaxID=1071 RepID=A0A2S6NKT8_RHOGL|nr:asparaginase [Rhodopila globiformis]PPQ35682.1 L-asparaginase [Rhodopila globiformis]
MPDTPSGRPRITVFSTGGTIASVPGVSVPGGGQTAAPTLTAADLVAAVPQLADVAEVTAVAFRQVASPDLTLADLIALAQAIEQAVAGGASGAVVTQGTDSLEETAFALDLLWHGEAPVVLTGAMRNPALPGADGPANLLGAAQVAASPDARGLGALVVFNDEVHLPLFVRKTHATSPATFRSPLAGPVGWIVEGRPRIALRPVARHAIRLSEPREIPPVALLTATLGDDGRLVPAVAASGCRGLVIEAMGGGHVPRAMVPHLAALADQMPVVLASRTGAGEGLRGTYGFPGSETDLLGRGLIHAGVLDGLKARLLLTLLLAAEAPSRVITDSFAAIGVPGSRPPFRWPAP